MKIVKMAVGYLREALRKRAILGAYQRDSY